MVITQKKAKRTKKRVRRPLTTEQIHAREKRNHKNGIRRLFHSLGFCNVDADGIEIDFAGRTGEIDDIFICENVLILMEYTVGQPKSTHLLTKKVLFDKINGDPIGFLNLCRTKYPAFSKQFGTVYPDGVVQIRTIYASKQDPSDELIDNCPNVNFFHGATDKYFQALTKTIERSARIEFLKFLGIAHSDFGRPALGQAANSVTYHGFLLPEGNSSYPTGFKIVSFYADPERLIEKSFVLRRDGWRDESHLYQRILVPKKIKQMRKYLVDESRVFVNNVIVTLPNDTAINDASNVGQNLRPAELDRAKPVSVHIPSGYDKIGIVDGQHRVFCYHEGSDKAEAEISKLRVRQHLMVTGIMYPLGTTDIERRSFEAKLFLEINDNQTGARSSLKHDIEVIIRPYSGIAVAKRVVQELGRRGPLKGMLQTSYFDSPNKIKTSSIVSYGLRPLVKYDGADSLFSIWKHASKEVLRDAKGTAHAELVEEYIRFCADKINEFLVQVKLAMAPGTWDIDTQPRCVLLSPTAINGLIVCLRRIIETQQSLSVVSHQKKLTNVSKFAFSSYKSSQWKRLGTQFFDDHYLS